MQALSIGVVVGIFIKSLAFLYEQIKNLVRSTQSFSVSGIWTAAFESNIPGKHVVEIFKITQNREKISLYLQHYGNITKTVRKYRGIGIFRGKAISLAYFDESRDRSHSGVFSLVLDQDSAGETIVRGQYAELGIGDNSNKIVIGNDQYIARKIRPNLSILARLYLGVKCFSSFEEANDFFVSVTR